MKTAQLTLVTIVAEALLEERIVHELRSLGATGFTIMEARGEGTRNLRTGEIPGTNVRIETIVNAATAERIVDHVSVNYFEHFGVIAFLASVEVVREGKYV
jgi:nitrogen regulatory protein P-II 2